MRLVIIATLCLLSPVAYAQTPTTGPAQMTAGVSATTRGGGGFSVPDPKSSLSAISMVLNRSFAQALGLRDDQRETLENILRKSGPLTGITLSEEEHLSLSGPQKDFLLATHMQRMADLVDEVLTPEQLKRLPQLVYQTEVARVGMGQAITSGRLAHDVGVTENQKANLQLKAARAEAKLAEAVKKAIAEAQAEVLSELTTEQKQKAEELLGEPYFFRDEFSTSFIRPPISVRTTGDSSTR